MTFQEFLATGVETDNVPALIPDSDFGPEPFHGVVYLGCLYTQRHSDGRWSVLLSNEEPLGTREEVARILYDWAITAGYADA